MHKERHIKASEFKAKCLQLMDEVAETGDTLVITKHGQPVAQLSHVPSRPPSLYGMHEGQFKIKGDIIAPVDVAWEAQDDAPPAKFKSARRASR